MKIRELERRIMDVEDLILNSQFKAFNTDSADITNNIYTYEKNPNPISVTKNDSYYTCSLTSEDVGKLRWMSSFRLLMIIGTELKWHNPLWMVKDRHKSEVRKGLKELEKYNILAPIHGTNIYYIFPNKLRKGRDIHVIASLKIYLRNKRKKLSEVTVENVIDLKKPANGTITPNFIRELFRP